MSGYRAQLPVAGRQVLVVGDGPGLVVEVTALLDAEAMVTVAAATVPAAVEDLADRRVIRWLRRTWSPSDVSAVDLVVTTVADEELVRAGSDCATWVVVTERVTPARSVQRGRVTLVGGGPGPAGLLTLAGAAALRTADVVVCDRLAPLSTLRELAPGAEVIDVAKVPRGRSTSQEAINTILVDRARAGQHVVRLKGGDPFVFGRGGEEAIACADAGVPVSVIPGVTSSVAGPALAGIPLTHRGVAQGFSVVSGHVPPGSPESTVDYAALARAGTTLVLLMAVATLPAILEALVEAGLDPATPAATVADAGMPTQRVVTATASTLADVVRQSGLGAPAITVVGSVVGLQPLGVGLESAQRPDRSAGDLHAVERTG
ncbi:uroporphyrinogen-III C-methyltransferase [Luteipulveratus mongoliensis]|uniref:uroporphyrinogen-III C-methyltransferase n=1 Tax=Luteipulveratus mongoliensis TaxID=571913 RepID=A0A0K1JM61_9MICO|nr:uroporphyrinogen-III C-methyltransferase [Luteipulveratus mongoliensis]AKU17796.1 uroporphyrin-III methyltransferase [Luteipulveratus mongoliensis]